jgi:NAD(P)-dependent dehydrogenase (short-subunit alcohol dehydrogenase family)
MPGVVVNQAPRRDPTRWYGGEVTSTPSSTVLLTGTSTGFGLLAAVAFAREGHRVFATMRTPSKAGPLLEAAVAAGVEVEVLPLDVTDAASVDAAVAEVLARSGRIDVVVNNAGIEVLGAVHLLADDEVARQLDTNVTGVVRVVRAVVPTMLAQGSGTIVNVGSVAGVVGVPYSGIYAASKHAVEALSEALHFELSHRGIRVRVVEPGQFATDLGSNAIHAAAMVDGSEEHDRFVRYRAAQKTLGGGGEPASPQVVADLIVRVATERPGSLRHPVGVDAELIVGTKHALSFEDFDTTMRAALNWHD